MFNDKFCIYDCTVCLTEIFWLLKLINGEHLLIKKSEFISRYEKHLLVKSADKGTYITVSF